MKSVMMNASQKLAKTTTKSHQNCLQKKKHTLLENHKLCTKIQFSGKKIQNSKV